MFEMSYKGGVLTVILFIIGFIFWMTQFFNMMSGKDEDFPGRYDKLIWAGLFIFGNIFGAIVWLFYIPPARNESKEENSSMVPDASE